MTSRIEPLLLVLAACVACSDAGDEMQDGAVANDGSTQDARVNDGATSDAAQQDAAQGTDAAIVDAGQDTGVDAALPDAAMPDAAMPMGEPTALTGITALHNQARANAQPTPSPALGNLTWSNTLAAAAQAWANQCQWNHSTSGYGENMYAFSNGSGTTAAAVMNNWVGEAAHYDYAMDTCAPNEMCGHYTQVVWRSTTQVGCGIATCNQNRPFSGTGAWQVVVCNYSPAGNNGNRPY